MPYIEKSTFFVHKLFKHAHVQTILPLLLRKTHNIVHYKRQRINTPDNDWLDLDFSFVTNKPQDSIAILSHGMEGDSSSTYMLRTAYALRKKNIDAVSWHFRGCSGEPNRKYSSYNAGQTQDLFTVVNYITKNFTYKNIFLIGFSLGGNVTLKFLGEKKFPLHKSIKKGIGISVPVDLLAAGYHITYAPINRLYHFVFLKSLIEKARQKCIAFERLDKLPILSVLKSLQDFDDIFTAPNFYFKDAVEYWSYASSKPHLSNITIPTLLINAQDDPMLPQVCYPVEEAKKSKYLFLEIPEYGGHLGFMNNKRQFWIEERIIDFLQLSS